MLTTRDIIFKSLTARRYESQTRRVDEASDYRPDIDGLRCLAVTSVVLYHALAWAAPSGFVGVDIFFVISGYLIGGIVFREAEAGKFSFANFYARRARRILPALFATIVVTILLGFLLLSMREAVMLAGSANWTLLGVSNVFFWRHIDYFSPDADRNPLLMTWSLAVEEQFYVLFPPLMLVLVSRVHRYRLHLVLAVCLGSLAIAIYQAGVHPVAGFYLLPSRIWELGLGAALAIVHAGRKRTRGLPGEDSTLLAAIAFAVLLASFLVYSDETPFPGVAALLPVAATVALIHTRASSINRVVLAHRWPVAVGLVSYSWYLWHWPLLTFVRIAANGTQSDGAMALTAAVSLLVAWGSWKWIETPFRRRKLPVAKVLFRYGLAIAATISLLQVAKTAEMFPGRLPAKADRVEAELRGGEACMSPFGTDRLPTGAACRPAGATVALLGDSHAAAYAPGLVEHLQGEGLQLAQFTKPSCSPLLGYGRVSDLAPRAAGECLSFTQSALAAILADRRIDTVVLAGFWPAMDERKLRKVQDGRIVPAPPQEALSAGLSATVDALRRGGKRVVLVNGVMIFREDPGRLLLAETIPSRRLLGDAVSAGRPADRPLLVDYAPARDVLGEIVRHRPDVLLVDSFGQFCPQDRCRIAAEGLPMFRDKQHLSYVGSAFVRWPDFTRKPTT